MTIEFKSFSIGGALPGKPVTVGVVFEAADIHEAENLIQGCRTLGQAKPSAATEKTAPPAEAPKPTKAKLAAVPKPPETKAAPLPAQPPVAGSGEADDKDAHADEDEAPAPKESAPPAAAKANGANGKKKLTVTKEMREGTFRVVCAELAKQGHDSKAALLAILPKLREHVPAIKAVAEEQIQARVEAAVDILGLKA